MREIEAALKQIESEYDCRILYAVEAGSRLWGYHDKSSDFDVRFIFVQPIKKYCSVTEAVQVIGKTVDVSIEIHGWDLIKTLKLFQKSNPSLYEWLFSTIIYLEGNPLIHELRSLAATNYSLKTLSYHYISLVNSNHKKISKTPKVYIQMLRAILTVRWMLAKHELPPLHFQQLLGQADIPIFLKEQLDILINKKQLKEERIVLNDIDLFIKNEMNEFNEKIQLLEHRSVDLQVLNQLLWQELKL